MTYMYRNNTELADLAGLSSVPDLSSPEAMPAGQSHSDPPLTGETLGPLKHTHIRCFQAIPINGKDNKCVCEKLGPDLCKICEALACAPAQLSAMCLDQLTHGMPIQRLTPAVSSQSS